MIKLPSLSKRLLTALDYIEKGDVCADIGTDHAYLPIRLVLSGISETAYACDVNEGPCARARENCAVYGVTDRVRISRRDGIEGLEDEGIDKFIIFGMGGELIASILDRSTVRDGTRFILNPMTKQERLRGYLSQNGYEILDETVIFSDSKYYQIIYAEKNGVCDTLSLSEQKYGKINISKRTPLFLEYVGKVREDLVRAQTQRMSVGAKKEDDDTLLCETELILKS